MAGQQTATKFVPIPFRATTLPMCKHVQKSHKNMLSNLRHETWKLYRHEFTSCSKKTNRNSAVSYKIVAKQRLLWHKDPQFSR